MLQSKALSLTALLSLSLALHVSANNEDPESVTKPIVASLDLAVTALKNNQKSLDKIDEVTLASKDEILKTANNIINQIPEETRKEAEKAAKEEYNDAIKSLKSVFKYHTKKFEDRMNKTVSQEHQAIVASEVKACGEKISDMVNAPETKEALSPLAQDLKAAAQPVSALAQDLSSPLETT